MKRLLLALAAAAALAGCGKSPEPAASDTAAAPATEAPAEAAPPAAAPATPADLSKAASAAQESAAETAATPGDAALERVVSMPQNAQLPGGRWKAGTNYRPMTAQPTAVAAGEVEVIEFMWLACGACNQLNSRVESWRAKLPPWVKFRQEHVMWGPSHQSLAKLLYTLEALGHGELIGKAFEEIHVKHNMLVEADAARTLAKQVAFAKANGIAEADFKREYNSFAVATRLQRADELTRRYRVDQTPVFIVNGKYYTNTEMAGNPADLMQLLDDLAASEKR